MTDLPLAMEARAALEVRSATRGAPMDPVELTALLRRRGYVPHPAVLAFERDFGGLTWTEPDDELGWLIGAGACLSADPAHGEPRGSDDPAFAATFALVPVAYAATDWIALMDADGVVWGQDLIADPTARPIADDGAALVAGLLTRAGVEGPAAAQRRAALEAWQAAR